ncbi:MAG: peptide chain release factor 1 [Chitinivibrionales bacterium]|nr:peptide chain release factor 1 [Chitinivibrionales bacterium]
MIEKVQRLIQRHKELEGLLATPETLNDRKKMEELGREYNQLGKVMSTLTHYVAICTAVEEAKKILRQESDHDLTALAHGEIQEAEAELPQLESQLRLLLIPKDPDDYKNAMVEIRAGTGGVEAGIFAADLYRMYTSYIEKRGWKIEIMSSSVGELGAVKEIIFMAIGENAYGTLKYESGVHRVQRIPQTESQGRIHTSAASVAVFPEAEDIDVELDPGELRIDVFRSSGPGGQNVNKTDSAVRVVHIPTGIIVSCQDEKSQHKNKAKALKVLKSRLLEMKRTEAQAAETASRRSMVGSGDRSAKIRTYNFPQGRVTDHRINLTLYKLTDIINGDIQELIDTMAVADIDERLKHTT